MLKNQTRTSKVKPCNTALDNALDKWDRIESEKICQDCKEIIIVYFLKTVCLKSNVGIVPQMNVFLYLRSHISGSGEPLRSP